MKKLTFDQLRELIDTIPQPTQRLGIFKVKINNYNKRYEFHSLKVSASYNPDVQGFSLNHYGWLGLPKQKYHRSKFHDEEDVAIHLERSEFEYAYKVENFNEISIITKKFNLQVNW